MAARETILTAQMTKTPDLASKECEASWHLEGFIQLPQTFSFP